MLKNCSKSQIMTVGFRHTALNNNFPPLKYVLVFWLFVWGGCIFDVSADLQVYW